MYVSNLIKIESFQYFKLCVQKENVELKHELQVIETESDFLEPEIRNIKSSHDVMETKKVETEIKIEVIK